MAHWYDFATILPPAGEVVMLRRYPEGTPPFFGTFDLSRGEATSQVATGYAFTTPWSALVHWAVMPGPPGPWPQPPSIGSTWRDPFWTPPTDGQSVWLRRWSSDSASVMANWRHAEQSFAIHGTPWLLPWHHVWKWKPR